MKILQFQAENVKRIQAVDITPHGSTVVIGGRNGQGKTSILDAIEWALSGAKSIPKQALRKGAASGRIRLDLGDAAPELIVERVFTESGRSHLEVRSSDGYLAPSPQAILDDLYSKLTCDPLAFIRLKPKEQVNALQALLGLDFSDLDAERARVYEARTVTNRELKQKEARLKGLPIVQDVPEQEISVAQLTDEMQRREQVNRENQQKRLHLSKITGDIETKERESAHLAEEIARLEERKANLDGQIAAQRIRRESMEQEVAELVDADLAEIREQLREADTTNRKVRQNQQHRELAHELVDLKAESDRFTKQIDELDAEKAERVASAQWPVEGLGFTDDGISFHGIPFEQASSAEQLRVSTAMGLALNPKLRIMLIRDGSLLDDASMQLLGELAKQHDAQIWLERVGDGQEVSVVIEDGCVQAVRTPLPEPEETSESATQAVEA